MSCFAAERSGQLLRRDGSNGFVQPPSKPRGMTRLDASRLVPAFGDYGGQLVFRPTGDPAIDVLCSSFVQQVNHVIVQKSGGAGDGGLAPLGESFDAGSAPGSDGAAPASPGADTWMASKR